MITDTEDMLSPNCGLAADDARYADGHRQCRGNWTRRLPEQPAFEPSALRGSCNCWCHTGGRP